MHDYLKTLASDVHIVRGDFDEVVMKQLIMLPLSLLIEYAVSRTESGYCWTIQDWVNPRTPGGSLGRHWKLISCKKRLSLYHFLFLSDTETVGRGYLNLGTHPQSNNTPTMTTWNNLVLYSQFSAVEKEGKFYVNPGSATGAYNALDV